MFIDYTTGDTVLYNGQKYFVLAHAGRLVTLMNPGGAKTIANYEDCEVLL